MYSQYIRIWIGITFTMLTACASGPPPVIGDTPQMISSEYAPKTEQEAIEYFFNNEEPDGIAGIWTWDDNQFQIAIIENNTGIETEYDYVGIVIRSDSSGWRAGQAKLLINSTASPGFFTGVYFTQYSYRENLSYELQSPVRLKINKHIGTGIQHLIRDYPSKGISALRKTPDGEVVASGTCFSVSPDGIAITSHHVIDGAKNIWVSLADGRRVPAVVEQFSAFNDLAVLRLAAKTPNYLGFAPNRSIESGDQVFTVGFPTTDILGSEAKFTEGSVSALSGVGGEASYMQISVPVQPGNSGGPVVNHKGHVVGVIAATAALKAFYDATGTMPQNVNWAVKGDYVKPLLEVTNSKPDARNREEAISRAKKAVCQVEAS